VPCLAPPVLREGQSLLPIWEMRCGISRGKVLVFTERKKNEQVYVCMDLQYLAC
jgi:hypothetical protein